MNKKIIGFGFTLLCLFIVGCGNLTAKDIQNKFSSKVKKNNSYYAEAEMELVNNDDVYNFDVKVSYLKDENYKVELINRANNYKQLILKNEDGVYVINPALNKSFKFQSDWPYNNSQAYLIQTLLNDMENTKDLKLTKEDNKYLLTTDVNYPNNKKITNQIIVFDKNINLKEVKVKDKNNVDYITVKYNKIEDNPNLTKEDFKLENNIKTSDNNANDSDDTEKTNLNIDESLFPLYLPTGTTLTSRETIAKEDGERVIMTFSGNSSFLLVEETASTSDNHETIPTYGEPYMLIDTIGVLNDTSLTWTSNGIEYYLTSDVISVNELIEIAQSINVLPVMK